MEIFIISAAISFIIYELIAYAQIPADGWFRVRGIVVRFDGASAFWARQTLRIASIVIFGAVILWVHNYFFPFDDLSQNKAKFIFGFFFGPLFGIWVNGIFRHPPGEALSRGQVIGGIGLIFFFILGSTGDEMGRLVHRYLKNLSSLKVAGTEFSFSTRSQNDKLQGPTTLPLAGSHSNSSGGLLYLSQLEEMIKRDQAYLALFAPTDAQIRADFKLQDVKNKIDAAREELKSAESFSAITVTPPIACLAAWNEVSADAAIVNKHLNSFVDGLRQMPFLSADEQRLRVSRKFVRDSILIASEMVAFTDEEQIKNKCVPLLRQFCPDELSPAGGDQARIKDRAAMMTCLERSLNQATQSPADRGSPRVEEQVSKIANYLQKFVERRGLEARPYYAIGLASAMAQLGSFEAVGSILDKWLQLQKNPLRPGSGSPIVEEWFEVRTRSILAAYFEEWMQREGAAASTALRNEQLDNLRILKVQFERRLQNAAFFSKIMSDVYKRTEVILVAPGSCASYESNIALWRNLFKSYITIEIALVHWSLNHPDYASNFIDNNFVETTNYEITRLANFDLSCLPYDAEVNFAQIIELLARNSLLYSNARVKTESEDVRGKRLDAAELTSKYGLAIIYDKAANEQARQGRPFLTRIDSSEAIEAQRMLRATLAQIQKAKEDLAH